MLIRTNQTPGFRRSSLALARKGAEAREREAVRAKRHAEGERELARTHARNMEWYRVIQNVATTYNREATGG